MVKGENAGSPAFSPFPTIFSKGLFLRVVKTGVVSERLEELTTIF